MKKQYAINIDATDEEILKAQLWCDLHGYELVFVAV